MQEKADIGLVGLGVMGQNLALNIADNGYHVAVFNRTTARVDSFVSGAGNHPEVSGTHSPEELVSSLSRPRRIILMVKAGKPVDQTIDTLLPLLEPGDLIIDGGNSHYPDTTRRTRTLAEQGILFLGTGISGGEEGARHGPSIMPGGNPDGWPLAREVLRAIAARAHDGEPCCEWVGDEGAGHYVKMVHNGIEYGDMQLIAESYHFLRHGMALPVEQVQAIFEEWNRGVLDSYLVQITADILKHRDADGAPLVDKIVDSAGQKGTGKWTARDALDLGVPLTLISEAVFARYLSSLRDERVAAASELEAGTLAETDVRDVPRLVDDLRDALYASKIVSYAQGFMLMQAAAREFRWQLDFGAIAGLWRAGCIIRSRFLDDIRAAFSAQPALVNLLLAPFFTEAVQRALPGWRRTLAYAVAQGLPAPAMSAALAFYDSYRSARLPADLIQAQRDYFGAHTYERIDAPRGQFFHTDWDT